MNSKRRDKNKKIKNDSIFERKGRLNYPGHQWHRLRRSSGLCAYRDEVVVSGRREAEGSEPLALIKNFNGEGKFVQGDITSEVDIT